MYEEIRKQFQIEGSINPYTHQKTYTTNLGRFLVTPHFDIETPVKSMTEWTITPLGDVTFVPEIHGFKKCNDITYSVQTHFIEKEICELLVRLNQERYTFRGL